MDRYSSWELTHFILKKLYDQYLENPDSVDSSGEVFQGYEFANEPYSLCNKKQKK